MSRADFYLHKAARCEMLARVAGSASERDQALKIARQYRQAAERENSEQTAGQIASGKFQSSEASKMP